MSMTQIRTPSNRSQFHSYQLNKSHQLIHSGMTTSTEEDPPYIYKGGSEEAVPKDVKKVIIDPSVTTIEEKAFDGCTDLASILIPDSVTKICEGGFYKCESLVSIEIPDSVSTIEKQAFAGCASLTSIVIPDKVTTINYRAFVSCTSLVSIQIPEGVTGIGEEAFFECKSLASIVIPDSVRTIGDHAFDRCKSLTSIVIPKDVMTIHEGAFEQCESLISIVVPESVTTIGGHAFDRCKSLKSIEIPDSVTKIGRRAFEQCTSLSSIVIPKGVTVIGKYAFQECTSLVSIVIHAGVPTIGSHAFIGCTSLALIVIPDSVRTIDERAFDRCTSLASIVIPDKVTTIGESAFQGCTSLASTVIPDSVESIGKRAFDGCTSLSSIVIPESASVGENAFSGCIPLARWAAAAYKDVPEWLKTRFDDRPLLKACYRSDVTKEKISTCLDPASAKVLDSLELSALQVLLMNEKVTQEMVDVLLKAHPDAVKDAGPLLGMYPLHLASNNPRAPLEVFESLRNTHTKDGRLVLMVADENNYLPCALAIRNGRSDDIILHLFEHHAIQATNLSRNHEKEKLESIYGQYIKKLSTLTEDFSFDLLQQHGWVSFVTGIEDQTKIATQFAQLIANKEWHIKIVRRLAYYKDLQGRLALESATKDIKAALEERLLFLGRFELDKGPPLHKTPTSLVIKAIDRRAQDEYREAFAMALKEEESPNENGEFIGEKGFKFLLTKLGVPEESFKDHFEKWDLDRDKKISVEECIELFKSERDNGRPREVVLKFMRNKEQFQREVDFRKKVKLDSKYVVGITDRFSCEDTDKSFSDALKSFSGDKHNDLRQYKYAIVMSCADRNLDTIFRSERPDRDEILVLARQLGKAIKHVHLNGLIHGDVKLQNVVRIGGRLRLIDLDAAAKIDPFAGAKYESFAGAKFSSGVLPPEMIAKLTVEETERFLTYFNDGNDEERAKILPKQSRDTEFFVVKTFRTHDLDDWKKTWVVDKFVAEPFVKHDNPVDQSELPYPLVNATVAIDLWSFGVILYQLYTGSPLFEVDRDDDLKTAEAMKKLCEWNVFKKRTELEGVVDPLARKLLTKILSGKPAERYQSMEEILADDYFVSPNLADVLEKSFKKVEESIRKVTVEMRINKKEIVDTIKNSTSVALTAIFEASDVKTPTCFVIRPYRIPTGAKAKDVASKVGKATEYIEYVLDTLSSCITKPVDFAAECIKNKLFEETMFLYLVDEKTGDPVCADGYPLEVTDFKEQVEKFLPLMSLGIQVLALTNKAAGIVSMLYPVVPGTPIPPALLAKATKFIEGSNKSGVIKKVMEEGSTASETVRGCELADFSAFLKDKDPECSYSGFLRRVCDKSTGMAMWVTESSAKAMEEANDAHDDSEDAEQLKSVSRQLEQEIVTLKQKIKTLEKKPKTKSAPVSLGDGMYLC